LEEQRKKEEEAAKEAKKHQKKDGILGFLMAQSDKKAEKGGLEFSMANLVIITNFNFFITRNKTSRTPKNCFWRFSDHFSLTMTNQT
jgi:hypothetical protein